MKHERLAALGLAVAAGVFRWVLSRGDHGIYWPDELFQSLEPAHRLVFGHGFVPWEFLDGARSWAFPGLIAAVMAVGGLAGGGDPGVYLGAVRLAFLGVAAGTTWGVWRLARGLGAGPLPSLAGAAAFGFAGVWAYFGHRAMSETASALPVVLGFAFALTRSPTSQQSPPLSGEHRWHLWLGASLLGLSVLLRLQNGVFCLGLLGALAVRRDWRRLGEAFAVLVVWALAFGALDWATWGVPFGSALKYLQFNLIEGKAAQWGVSPFGYYFEVLWRSLPVVSVLVAALGVLSVRRAPVLLVTAVAFLWLHAFVPHKELRFLLPAVPLFCALAAVGAEELGRLVHRRVGLLAAALLAVAVVPSMVTARSLTFWHLGAYPGPGERRSAWDDFGDVNRLLLAASRRDDLCGLKLEGVHLAWSGGYTHLHRHVPLYGHRGPDRRSGRFNFVVTSAQDHGGERIAVEGGRALLKLHDRPCVPDPHFDWKLP